MGSAVSSSHVVSATPSYSGSGLTPFPCSTMEFLTREAVLLELLQCESFSRPAVLHKLLQQGSLSGYSSVGALQGSHILSLNLLQHGFIRPWVCRFWQDPAPVLVSTGYRWTSATLWTLMVHVATSAWLAPQAAGGSHFWCLEHLLPVLHWPWCLQDCSSHILSLLFAATADRFGLFSPIYNMLSQMLHYHPPWSWPWPMAALSWSWLEDAETNENKIIYALLPIRNYEAVFSHFLWSTTSVCCFGRKRP